MLIIEGPDLSGKTTIGKRITELTGRNVYHFGSPPKSKQEILKRAMSGDSTKIYDRHPFISEQVYMHMPGRKQLFSYGFMAGFMCGINPTIIYCNPGFGFLVGQMQFLKTKPHKGKEHVEIVRKSYEDNFKRYVDVMHSLSKCVKVIEVNFRTITDLEIEEIVNEHFGH